MTQFTEETFTECAEVFKLLHHDFAFRMLIAWAGKLLSHAYDKHLLGVGVDALTNICNSIYIISTYLLCNLYE